MELNKKNVNIPFVGWENLDSEQIETEPHVILTIKDAEGNIINKITKTASEGVTEYLGICNISIHFQFLLWRSGSIVVVVQWQHPENILLIYLNVDNKITHLDGPVEFDVVPIREGVLKVFLPRI